MRMRTQSDYRARRHFRVRKKVSGTPERPRMCVYVSNLHMYVQFVDDAAARTLAAVSTLGKGFPLKGKNNAEAAAALGQRAAEAAKEKGISRVVFDRGGFAYGGRVKILAEAARKAGLQF